MTKVVGVICQEGGEDNERAATRVWTARECFKKAGIVLETPLTMKSHQADGWILFNAGEMTIASVVVSVKTSLAPLAVAVLV